MFGPYKLSEDEEMIVTMVKDLAKDKIAPRSAEIDRKGEFPWDILEHYKNAQILSLPIPEQYGGGGYHEMMCCVVLEEIAKVCANSAHILADHWLGSIPMILGGNEEQKQRFLTQWCTRLAAFSLTEPEAGSDAGGIKTRATLKGDKYILNGQKCFCTDINEADFVTIFARSSDAPGTKGLSAFTTEKKVPGLTIGKTEDQMGMRGTRAAEIMLEDCAIPAENLLSGKEGTGFKWAMQTLDRTRPVDAGLVIGIAQSSLQYALDYTRQRKQFGQALADFQALQFWMADMATEIEAARGLIYEAAWMIDHGQANSKLSAMSKRYASDVAVEVCTNSMQLCGGYGYMKDFPLEQKFRDARLFQIVEGANQVLRMVIFRGM